MPLALCKLGLSFSEPASVASSPEETQKYELEKVRLTLVNLCVGLTILLLLGFVIGVPMANAIEPFSGNNRWLFLIEYTLAILLISEITLPLEFYKEYVLEHRYNLSNQTVQSWFWKHTKMFLLTAPLSIGLIAGLYAVLWSMHQIWWLMASVGVLLLSIVLGQIFPIFILPLFYKSTKLENNELLARFTDLAKGTGIKIEDVYRMNLSKETKKANAMLTGLGKTKRVIIADTLLDSFTPDEIQVVFAHELGHSVYNHLVKGMVVTTIITIVIFYLSDLFIKAAATAAGHSSPIAISALPLYLFTFSLLGTIIGPLQKAVSRHFERESDWYALERTKDAEAFRAAFHRLAQLNKADMSPSRLVVIFFHDHPPISERLGMADRWLNQRT